MPRGPPNLPRVTVARPPMAFPPVARRAEPRQTKAFEYGGLEDAFSPSSSRPGARSGFDIEQRKANAGFEYGGLATPKK
jgi:hypothetical protein